jgi:lysophospholipid acyltransferase (LPLAT)-like uncharacterized protein
LLTLLHAHQHLGITILVSPSRDGQLVLGLLPKFGYKAFRGSSSEGGVKALQLLLANLREGGCVGLTPDGPRGPRHSLNLGPAWLARESGLQILTVGTACDRAWRLKSWDRFTIPKPRARLVISYGEPIHVAKGANEADLEAATELARQRLLTLETEAFAHLALPPDW